MGVGYWWSIKKVWGRQVSCGGQELGSSLWSDVLDLVNAHVQYSISKLDGVSGWV